MIPSIPAEVSEARSKPSEVEAALVSLAVAPPEDFHTFFLQYQGPFSSEKTGFLLLDICIEDGGESILLSTETCRSEFDFPRQFVVLTSLLEGVLVYDTGTGFVYDVDFEGGERALIAGDLEPKFRSFTEFLEWFFG